MKAWLLGVVVTAPVGPVGALVIRRTLRVGWWRGVTTGLGAALADSLFASVAALGLASVENFVLVHERRFALIGGIILLVMAAVSFRKHRAEERAHHTAEPEETELDLAQGHPAHAFLRSAGGSFLLTLSNPITMIGFAGAFAAFGLWVPGRSRGGSALLVLAVFCGAMSWWSSLAWGIGAMSRRLSKGLIFKVHYATDAVILASALLCFYRGL